MPIEFSQQKVVVVHRRRIRYLEFVRFARGLIREARRHYVTVHWSQLEAYRNSSVSSSGALALATIHYG